MASPTSAGAKKRARAKPAAPTPPRLSRLIQQRSRETRHRLIQSATRLWFEKGFDETTVAEVCRQAGVSKGTFYFYFEGKEDLLLELAIATSERIWDDWLRLAESQKSTRQVLREIVSSISRRVERTPRKVLARTVLEVLGSVERWPTLRGSRKDFASVYGAAFTRGQARKEISTKYTARELSDMQTMITLQAMLAWARNRKEPLDALLWRRTEAILSGAATPSKK